MDLRHLLISITVLVPATGFADTTLTFTDFVAEVQGNNALLSKDMLYQNGTLIGFDHQRKTYMVMDEKTMAQMNDQMSAKQKQLQAQLASLPKKQREALEKMMKGKMPTEMPKQVKHSVQAGGSGNAAGYDCQNYTVLENDEPVGKTCIAPAKAVGMNKREFNTLATAMTKLQAMSAGRGSDGPTLDLQKMGGIPVEYQDLRDGKKSVLKSTSNEKLGANIFEIPANYTEQKAVPQ